MAQWVTPPGIESDGDHTVLGEINFGIDSRMFVLAFRDTDDDNQIEDYETSIPAYNRLVDLTNDEKATYAGDEFLIVIPRIAVELQTTQTRLIIVKEGEEVDTGLRIEANGQITGKLKINDALKQLVLKVELRDPPSYTRNVYYPSYSHMHFNGRFFGMRVGVNAPHLATTGAPDRDVWEDIGSYTPQYPINDINGDNLDNQRLFRIIINTQNSDLVDFITDPDLGEIRVGEQFGESHRVQFETSRDELMSFELNETHKNVIGTLPLDDNGVYKQLPKGLTVQPDGLLTGTAIGPTGTYEFTITAKNAQGLAKQQTFTLDVKAGMAERNFGAYLRVGGDVERKWYDAIMTKPFNTTKLYRPTDPNYGVVTTPRLLLKRNLDGTFANTALDNMEHSYKVAIAKFSGYQSIDVRVGNTRVRTALDTNGEPIYDLVYKEILPPASNIAYSIDPYLELDEPIPAITNLKEDLFTVFGSQDLYVQDDITRGIQQVQNGIFYYDDAPMWMTIPEERNDVVPGYKLALPIAYVLPGEGEAFISTAIEYGQLADIFYNESITFSTMELFDYETERMKSRIVKFRSS